MPSDKQRYDILWRRVSAVIGQLDHRRLQNIRNIENGFYDADMQATAIGINAVCEVTAANLRDAIHDAS